MFGLSRQKIIRTHVKAIDQKSESEYVKIQGKSEILKLVLILKIKKVRTGQRERGLL